MLRAVEAVEIIDACHPSSTSHSNGVPSSACWNSTVTRLSWSNISMMPNPMRTNAENATSAVKWRFTERQRAAHAPEREADDEEREPEAERVGNEQRRAGPHAVLVRRDGEDRPQDRPDARRPTEPECGARDERRGFTEAAELRVEALLLVEPRRAQEQRPEQEEAHADHDRARDARQQVLVVAERLADRWRQ